LDIFTDEARQNQVHDFNLDIRPFPSGIFWTNFIPGSGVHMHDEGEAARLDVHDLALFDYFNVNNALSDGNSIDAKVSYNLRWADNGTPLTIDDGSRFHFDGTSTTATISWRAREAGFRFRSSPAHTTKTNFALIGKEQNGVFYRAG
jgi:hypothetical protein